MPTTWVEQSDGTYRPVLDRAPAGAEVAPSSATTASAGVSPRFAREDHSHGYSAEPHTHTDVDEVVFSQPGGVTASESGRYYPSRTVTLKKVSASLGTGGSSSTVVAVKRNGVSLGTVTLVSSDQFESGAFNQAFTGDTDYLTMEVTSAGAGAAKLTMAARFEATL